ncbi:MAG: hypothetical protein KC464_11195, partial [Myxococcales bacterium]|nr:hypothetical protein [Myxococcales bacterium]
MNTAKKAPAKKTPAKKAPARKAPATKTPARKAPATRTPARKAPATKTPARKAPARKAPPAKPAGPRKIGPRADFGAPIDGFFARQPAALRPVVDALRALVEAAAPDATASLKWGMPV